MNRLQLFFFNFLIFIITICRRRRPKNEFSPINSVPYQKKEKSVNGRTILSKFLTFIIKEKNINIKSIVKERNVKKKKKK